MSDPHEPADSLKERLVKKVQENPGFKMRLESLTDLIVDQIIDDVLGELATRKDINGYLRDRLFRRLKSPFEAVAQAMQEAKESQPKVAEASQQPQPVVKQEEEVRFSEPLAIAEEKKEVEELGAKVEPSREESPRVAKKSKEVITQVLDDDSLYVYAISTTPENEENVIEELPGIDKLHPLLAIDYRSLRIYASKLNPEEFKEISEPVGSTAKQRNSERRAIHNKVVKAIEAKTSIVPIEFGTLYLPKKKLERFLDKNYDNLTKTLQLLRSHEEWNIKLWINDSLLTKNFLQANVQPEGKAGDDGQAPAPDEKEGVKVASELIAHELDLGRLIYVSLNKLAAESKLTTMMTLENAYQEGWKLVLQSFYLVKKEKAEEFSRVMESMRKKYDQFGCVIQAIGPWPPYTFTKLKLDLN